MEDRIFNTFNMGLLGSASMLVKPQNYDPTDIGRAIEGTPRWRLLGFQALGRLGPGEMSYRLNASGIAYMLPVYMLSAMWIGDEDWGFEALGDLFIPPISSDWIALRALTYGFGGANSENSESISESVSAYRQFVAYLSESERCLMGDWLELFSTSIFPAFTGKTDIVGIAGFWRKTADAQ